MRILYRIPILPALLFAVVAAAQISEGGLPPSFLPENASFVTSAPPLVTLSAPDVQKIWKEEAQKPEQGLFSTPLTGFNLSPSAASGDWTVLPSGDRIWRLRVGSPEALGLLLIFEELRLAPGARLFAYTPGSKQVYGAYTEESCLPSGEFMIGILQGQEAVLELYEPAAQKGNSILRLTRVDYVYDPAGMAPPDNSAEDFGDSYACNINVNCAQGQNWQSEKRGVARILMIFSDGAGWCSGTLIANTSGSGEPYFLTAHHCQIIGLLPNFNLWRFDFDYEAPGCTNPATEPSRKSILGSSRISYRHETDFLLLKLNHIPGSYNLYFNGWNRTAATNSLVTKSTFIHHPNGDIKKITLDNQPATIFNQIINWGPGFGSTPGGSHWLVTPDEGIYEPGSSGCPLFDQNKRIVGQLHGGNLDTALCKVTNSWFGRFDLSWDQGPAPESRLKEWLDPGGTSALTQNGYVQPAPTQVDISGTIKTHWGDPMPNVLVNLSGGATASTRTNAQGQYAFSNLPAGLDFTVAPVRDTNDVNGITTFDLALVNKHVLSLEVLDSPWKIIAADANGSKSVSTIDIVEGRKVLLGINTTFPVLGAWRFFPASTIFPNPANPFTGFPGGLPSEFLQFTALGDNINDADFFGVKVGDVNNNAKPGG